MSENEKLSTQINTAMAAISNGAVGIAVSGGSDSIALLRLLSTWGQEHGRKVYAATVNHNLRKDAQAEADFVADLCQDIGVLHHILSWDGWDGKGNLQNEARIARKSLLSGWAKRLGIDTIALGHTRDDQAETFLMRLARGSGVDGLSGMQQISGNNPVWVRPLLTIKRHDLRIYLNSLGQNWVDDPSNENDDFDRVKVRKIMPELAKLGLGIDRLAGTADNLQSSRKALEHLAQQSMRNCCEPSRYGTVSIDLGKLQSDPTETQYRVLSYVFGWVSGAYYRPRFSALKEVYRLLRQGNSQTLGGCFIKVISAKQIIVMREVASMPTELAINDHYDARWHISYDREINGVEIRPLGEKGILQMKNWRDLSVLRDILLQMPAAWVGETVISAPYAGFEGPVHISLKNDMDQFFCGVVSH